MTARHFIVAGTLFILLLAISPAAQCTEYDANGSPFHKVSTISDTQYDVYRFSIGLNQVLNWKVNVTDGRNIDAYVMDQDQVSKAASGQTFEYYRYESKENVREGAGSKSTSGDYAIFVIVTPNTHGNSNYTIDITKRSMNTSESMSTYFCYAVIIIGIVVGIIGAILRMKRIARAIASVPPKQPETAPSATSITGGGLPGQSGPVNYAEPYQSSPNPVSAQQSPNYGYAGFGPSAAIGQVNCPSCGNALVYEVTTQKYWCQRENRWF